MNSLFASTARGLEELLKTELENLGAVECQVVQGGVHFKGDTRLVYQSLMWSRLASRIMLPLGECKVYSDLDLYLGVFRRSTGQRCLILARPSLSTSVV